MKTSLSAVLLAVILTACAPVINFEDISQGASVLAPDSLPQLPTLDDMLRTTPVSTSFDDVYPEALPPEITADLTSYRSLAAAPRTKGGDFILLPGLYALEAESFCLKPGTYGPGEGDGYLPAPLEGDRGEIIEKILSSYASHPAVSQRDVQVLLWAIIAQTKLLDMPAAYQATARALLTEGELFDLNGGALGLIPESVWRQLRAQIPPDIAQIYAAERELRQVLRRSAATYEELEDIAVLVGAAPPEDLIRPVARGSWAAHPGGYFVRYFPSGYQSTRVEVYVPSAGGDGGERDH